ncbi:MAG: endonuclease/exonuclease/phosphatase family protein [Candidatus Dactylopiibacterium sp.]|nr:endonuclease/exonuclease/phosphatase family protein [Candidatus Dactylopiibacterium sp.]
MSHRLRICSYNIHKGFSQLNRHMVIHELRDKLQALDPDIALLQEVQGLHLKHQRRHANWPELPQHEFLAGDALHAAYGGNAAYDHGHHGNAVLSRYPILHSTNHDVSLYRLERRGILHCEVELPAGGPRVHCLCAHLSLTEGQRRRQLRAMADYVEREIPPRAPLLIAGDFNDWRGTASHWLERRLGLVEAFTALHGLPARSFPARMPVLRLDRVYLRGIQPVSATVLWGAQWVGLSDHAPLSVEVLVS